MSVACFGDSFSHTYAAAVQLAGEKTDVLFCDSVYDTLERVRSRTCETAIVPMENSFEGTVAATCDALGELGLYIVQEIVLPVRQCLIVQNGVALQNVRTVYSHPQALAQCRTSLRKLLPHVKTEAVAYTSAGLDKLDEHSAAIARAPRTGQIAAVSGLEDSPENCTRFVAVQAVPRMSGNKVSVLFSTLNRPGALLDVLRVMDERGLNMTKIESRPAKKRLGQYVFYVDFLYYGKEGVPDELFAALAARAVEVRYLGRYPQYEQKSISKESQNIKE